jgi:hypothetical protein
MYSGFIRPKAIFRLDIRVHNAGFSGDHIAQYLVFKFINVD